MQPAAIGLLCATVLLLATTVMVAVMQLGMRRGPFLYRSVRDCAADGCVVALPPLVPNAVPTSVRLPHAKPHFSAYNPSVTRMWVDGHDTLVSTARVSSFTYCPGSHRLSFIRGVEDHLLITIGARAYHVRIPPAWASQLWPKGALTVGLQDARPVGLTHNVLGLVCTAILPRDGNVPRMSLLVVPLAEQDEGEEQLTPHALILLEPTGGRPQKNWMPYVYNERLWFVKHVAPQTCVSLLLRDVLHARGVVTLHTNVELADDYAALDVASGKADAWRGSTPLIPRIGHPHELIAVIHRVAPGVGPLYDHAFCTFDSVPPFRLRRVSRPLRVQLEHTHFTFVAGMVEEAGAYVVTFGADDCYVEHTSFARHAVDQLLEWGPTTPTLHIPIRPHATMSAAASATTPHIS